MSPLSPAVLVGQTVTLTLLGGLLFPVATALTLGVWIYLDALARDSDHPLRWAIEVTLLPPLVLAYVRYRGERTRPQSDRERLALTCLLALLAAMMAGTVLSPPDVFAQPRNTFGALLVLLPLFYWLVYYDGSENAGDSSGAENAGDSSSAENTDDTPDG